MAKKDEDFVLPPPINPFDNDPGETGGALNELRLPLPTTAKVAPEAPKVNLATKEQTSIAKSTPVLNYMAPVSAGIQAGSSVSATPDSSDALMQAGAAGLAGAAGGALSGAAIGAAGGPIGAAGGAVIGGVVGLVSGGVQAYSGLKAARSAKRKSDKDAAYIRKWNEEERKYNRKQDAYNKSLNAQSRSDNQEQLRYSRRQNALASQWKAFQATMDIINTGIKDDERIKAMFVRGGR